MSTAKKNVSQLLTARHMQMLSFALVFAALLLYSNEAAAELQAQSGVLDRVTTAFANKTSTWLGAIKDAALWLFWTLGTISLAWTFGMLAIRRADIQEFFAEFVRFILFFGFFLWLLLNGELFAEAIIDSLRQLAGMASGTTSLSPSAIVGIGFEVVDTALDNSSLFSPIDSAVLLIMAMAVLLMLATIAINMMLLIIEAWILLYAGIWFLGFGGSKWTSDMAVNYFKAVLNVAVQLFAMTLLVAVGQQLLNDFANEMGTSVGFDELAVMIVASFALLMLIMRIPSLLAGIITGHGPGPGGLGAGTVAAAGAGMALGAAGAGVAAAKGTAGAGSAVKAASQAAKQAGGGSSSASVGLGGGSAGGGGQSGASPTPAPAGASPKGSSSAGSSGGGAGATGGSGGGAGGNSGGGSGGKGKSAGVSKSTMGNLALGAKDAVKNKVSESLSTTKGGKIAEAIKERQANQASALSGGDIGGGLDPNSESLDMNAEAAAFEQRHSSG